MFVQTTEFRIAKEETNFTWNWQEQEPDEAALPWCKSYLLTQGPR